LQCPEKHQPKNRKHECPRRFVIPTGAFPSDKEGKAQWRNLLFSRPVSIPLSGVQPHNAGATVEERRFSAAQAR
jgi:hypothetical protein